MDEPGIFRYFPDMAPRPSPIPAWQLYGEDNPFPDILHIERIVDRAEGLHWRIPPHRHLHLHQVFLILSGEVRLTADGQHFQAATSVMMNIPRGTVHGFDFAAGTEGYVLTLPAANFPELFATRLAALSPLGRAFIAPAAPELAAIFIALAAVHGGSSALRHLRLRASAMMLGSLVAETAPPQDTENHVGNPRIAAFETLIRSHLDQQWTLADYSAKLAVSERHLRRMCLQATGMSAHMLVETIRLREACRLLAYTRMRVQEVGFALGYDDPAYFARAFRRVSGVSPSNYRTRLDG